MKKYRLSEYIRIIDEHKLLVAADYPQDFENITVKKIAYNSSKVIPGTMFICKGAGFKEEYLDIAINKGAFVYISEVDYHKIIPCILVNDVQKSLSSVSILFYNNPGERLNLIGITGTKGKSTTCYYVKYILDEYLQSHGRPAAGIISSIDTYDGKIKEESHLTTPESLEVQMHYYNAVNTHISHMVTEVSSQALKYGRLYGVNFDIGVFLNISEDHISPVEHSDLEDYFISKLKLFNQCKVACVNLNSENAARVLEAAQNSDRLITFGTQPNADIYGYNLQKDGFETVFKVKTDRFDKEFRLSMPGLFNVDNALAAVAVAYAMDIPAEYIYAGLYKARSSGRMEIYTSKNHDRIIIVDYAHNKLSFNKLYESTKSEYPGRKIFTVFGCPGGKAYIRRRDLGILSGLYSDKVILTSEDPGDESVRDICEDIAQYVRMNNDNYEIIEDREEAIKKSILLSDCDTVVLITGKGNETRQKIGKKYVPCRSDVEAVIQYLHEYDDTVSMKEAK